jgi:hypothetical protein
LRREHDLKPFLAHPVHPNPQELKLRKLSSLLTQRRSGGSRQNLIWWGLSKKLQYYQQVMT